MLNIKSELAPKGMKFDVTDFMISGKYCTIFTVVSFPKYIAPGYLSDLSNIAGVKVVAKHIPLEFSTMQKMINKEISYAEFNEEITRLEKTNTNWFKALGRTAISQNYHVSFNSGKDGMAYYSSFGYRKTARTSEITGKRSPEC